MTASTSRLSLTRPRDPERLYEARFWQSVVGPALAVVGLGSLMLFFIFATVVASWVADLPNPNVLTGRVETWEAWLFPAKLGALGVIQFGIVLVLWGIIRRLWVRVEAIKTSLPALCETIEEGS